MKNHRGVLPAMVFLSPGRPKARRPRRNLPLEVERKPKA